MEGVEVGRCAVCGAPVLVLGPVCGTDEDMKVAVKGECEHVPELHAAVTVKETS